MKCKNCEYYEPFCYHCDISGNQYDGEHECSVEQDMEAYEKDNNYGQRRCYKKGKGYFT